MLQVQIPDIDDPIYNRPYKIWTPDDELFLIQNYKKMSNKKLASLMNRTIKSIRMKAENIGITDNMG